MALTPTSRRLQLEVVGRHPSTRVEAPVEDGPELAPVPGAPVEATEVGSGGRTSLLAGLIRTARPRQWAKNVLVFAAPGAAGLLGHADPLLKTLGAFGIFCLAASGTYFMNDAIDSAADRLHPVKRHRPVAAGVVPIPVSVTVGVILMGAGIGLAYLLAGQPLATVMGVYVVINFAYSVWLKDEPVVDLAAVASGFVLRAIAGGVAVGVTLSNWFLIVASFGSLLMVAGKRHAEHLDLGDERADHRPTLGHYSLGFLRYVRSLASAVAITAYCIWAFDKAASAGHGAIWFQLSIVPFVIAILRYALLMDAGEGGAPEELVLRNRPLQILGVVWIGLFAVGVYGH
jgi:decaprenyl-phosphate phosphoribosyltransferase